MKKIHFNLQPKCQMVKTLGSTCLETFTLITLFKVKSTDHRIPVNQVIFTSYKVKVTRPGRVILLITS